MSNQIFQSESFYVNLSEAVHALTGIILFNFAKHECSKKDLIIRNFVARSATSLKSVMSLWRLGDYPNAWVINRTMLDRLFHLHDLGQNNTHQLFDDWSFYEISNGNLSESEAKEILQRSPIYNKSIPGNKKYITIKKAVQLCDKFMYELIKNGSYKYCP